MIFEWIEFLNWNWLIAFHLIAIAIFGFPFAWTMFGEWMEPLRKFYGSKDES